MSFLRMKLIKGKYYAYIVENLWKNEEKSSRQKVRQYIGRVYSFEIKKDLNLGFLPFINKGSIERYVVSSTFITMIEDMIKWEFYKHGISNAEFDVELEVPIIKRAGREVCIKINEGFLCGFYLERLINFRKVELEEDEEITGYNLAKAFVDAGINIPQEMFIKIFERMRGIKNE